MVIKTLENNNFIVQELVSSNIINGETIPERFVVKNPLEEAFPSDLTSDHAAAAAAAEGMDVPIIDLGLLLSSSSPELAEKELLKFRSALSSWGCFQAINHGIELEFLDNVREISKQFFAMPSEEKLKYLREDNGFEGYGTDLVFSDQQDIDWNDRLTLFVLPENTRKLKYWPQEHGFSQTLHEYTLRMRSIVEVMFKAMARSLNLKTSPFQEQCGDGFTVARFNFYPRCPRPDLVHGLKPHCDISATSIVLQDKEVEGLQLLKDDKWVRVPIIPHALFILVGDQVEIISNGVFKSPTHRAVTSSQYERISIVMFTSPNPDREIGPAEELIDESRPRMYRNIKNYSDLSFRTYQEGKKGIDEVKI